MPSHQPGSPRKKLRKHNEPTTLTRAATTLEMMTTHITRLKIRNVLSQIENQLYADTPFRNVPKALLQLRHIFEQFEGRLVKAEKLGDFTSAQSIAETVNQKILDVLPILGLLLRSTNVRNAFELLEPLQGLSTSLLGQTSRLVLSAEWDYVPFAYPQSLEDLRSFIFIGLPSSESANFLVLPLAGHELGHAVWRRRGLEGEIYNTVIVPVEDAFKCNIERFAAREPNYRGPNDLVSRNVLSDAVGQSVEYAVSQAEEYFCDFMALALFGESHLTAFAYILAPGMGRERKPNYPSQNDRAAALVSFAERLPVRSPENFVSQFRTNVSGGTSSQSFNLTIAEYVIKRFLPAIWNAVSEVLAEARVARPNLTESQKILQSFQRGVPFPNPCSLGDIANGAWARFDEIVAENIPFERKAEKLDGLNEMALKTTEALEFNERLRRAVKQ